MIAVSIVSAMAIVAFSLSACSDPPAPPSATDTPKATTLNEPPPALADWDGRHYDIGIMSNPTPTAGGYVLSWDRLGLITTDAHGHLRDTDAFSRDVVEPWQSITNLADSPFTNVNPALRRLVLTPAAWTFAVSTGKVFCPGDAHNSHLLFDPPPWHQIAFNEWVTRVKQGPRVALLTFDAQGQVVSIRPVAGC